MRSNPISDRQRTYAFVAIAAILAQKAASYLILSKHHLLQLDLDLLLNIQSIIFYWIITLAVVVLYEKRGVASLGFKSGRWQPSTHLITAILGLFIPFLFVGFNLSILLELLEQLVFIALPEEVLWRGYFQHRLSNWIGSKLGIMISSILFGIGHLLSLHARRGHFVLPGDLFTFLQTFLGGLVLGFLFMRSKSIYPGSILHIFGNVFLSKLIGAI